MQVKELIEKLQLLDGTAAVMIPGCDPQYPDTFIDALEVVPVKLAKCGYDMFSPSGSGPKFDAVVICFNENFVVKS